MLEWNYLGSWVKSCFKVKSPMFFSCLYVWFCSVCQNNCISIICESIIQHLLYTFIKNKHQLCSIICAYACGKYPKFCSLKRTLFTCFSTPKSERRCVYIFRSSCILKQNTSTTAFSIKLTSLTKAPASNLDFLCTFSDSAHGLSHEWTVTITIYSKTLQVVYPIDCYQITIWNSCKNLGVF